MTYPTPEAYTRLKKAFYDYVTKNGQNEAIGVLINGLAQSTTLQKKQIEIIRLLYGYMDDEVMQSTITITKDGKTLLISLRAHIAALMSEAGISIIEE